MKYSEISRRTRKAKKCIDNKEFDKAIELVQPIIEYDKLNNPKAFILKLLAQEKENYERVLEICNSLIEKNKEKYFYFTVRGILSEKFKEFDMAKKDFKSSLMENPNYFITYNYLGIIYDHINDYNESLRFYDLGIQLNPNYPSFFNNKGVIYAKKGEYEKSLKYFDKVIELDEKYVTSYYNKAVVYDLQNNNENSILYYNKAIHIESDYDSAYKNRGDIYFKIKDYKNAISDYNKAILLNNKEYQWLESKINLARTEIEERKKNEQNQQRSEISKVIDEIKKLLEYKEKQVCHYTKIEVFRALCNGSKLRFSHSNLVNDPTEGKTLYGFLNVPDIERKGLSGFIGSFVESRNNNALPLWRAYGSDGKGVSFCLEMKSLTELRTKADTGNKVKEAFVNINKTVRKLYKIAYIDDDGNVILNGRKNSKITDKLQELKELLEPLINDHNVKNEEALEPVVEIQYLFKNAIYKAEREVRYYELLKDDYPLIQWDNEQNPPTTYIEVENSILTSIRNVTVGPKAEDASTWVAWYKTMLAREGNKDVSVTQSKIPYR